MPTKILLVDDHSMFRKGLRLLLEEEADMQVVAEAGNGREGIQQVRAYRPDVVVMDITMPEFNGIEATQKIVGEFPEICVVALSIHGERRFVKEMLQAGAAGYILKDSVPEEMINGIRTVVQGQVYLSTTITGVVVSEYVKVLSDAAPEKVPPVLPVLRTKLYRPQLTQHLIPRTHLVNRLEILQHRPTTLVSAAAGYGKSTMASLWLEAWGGAYGWVSLDEEENDLRAFLTYLIAAIQSPQGAGFTEACKTTQAIMQGQELPPLLTLSRSLLNDLDEIETPFILVLDDYHKIRSPNVHELLSELLTHPVRNMHLMLLTRRDPPLPVSALRGHGQINEIGIAELRFTAEETGLFLSQKIGHAVDETTAAAIHERLEGWATGFGLIAHSLGQPKDLDRLLAGLKGNFGNIVEYLLAEVLSKQSPQMARVMMAAAIADRFCASLCDSLDRSEDVPDDGGISGEQLIEHLRTNNLFLIPLDDENRWYRYHHLFQRLLLGQLKQQSNADDVSKLHIRAGKWLAGNGFIDEAVRHAVAGNDISGAACLAEQHRKTMLNGDQWYIFEKWMDLLPDSEIEQRSELLMARVWSCYYQGQNAAIPPMLAAVESLLRNAPDEQHLYGEIYLFNAVFSFWQGDIALSRKYINDALERIPETHPMVRGFAEMYFGLAGCMDGQAGHVLQVLSDRLNHSSIDAPRKMRLITTLIWVHLISGDLVAASTRNKQLMDLSTENNSAIFHAWGLYHQGVIHFCRSELDSAIQYLDKSSQTGYLILKRANVDCLAGLSLAYQALQQADKANQTVARVFESTDLLNDPTSLAVVNACKDRLSLLRGETVIADGVQKPGQASDIQPMVFWLEVPAITNCRVLVAEGSDAGLREAEKRLSSYLRLNQSHHNTFRVIEIMALQSQAVYRQGRLDEALSLLGQAIKMAEPGGWVQPFVDLGPAMADLLQQLHQQNVSVDYIERILSEFKENQIPLPSHSPSPQFPPSTSPLIEPLTHREQDVMELLAQRFQNKEIADQLCISPGTVKGHLKNIYSKLGANSRRDAVARAKRYKIIE